MSWTKKPRQDLANEPEQTLKATLRYLGRREYTAKELEQRLRERGAVAEDIADALAYAQERGYQNDIRAGEAHIRQRINYAPRGRALVRQELRQRGLGREMVENLLEEHYPPQAERDLLRRMLAKEQTQTPITREEARRLWQRTARRMAAKGFDNALISEEISAWLPEPPKFWE